MCFWGKSEKKVVEQGKRFRTFENMALDTLRELEIKSPLGEVSLTIWAKAMGYKGSNAFYWTYKKLKEANKITVVKEGTKKICEYNLTPEDEKVMKKILKNEVLG